MHPKPGEEPAEGPLNGIPGTEEDNLKRNERDREAMKMSTEAKMREAEELIQRMQISQPTGVSKVLEPGNIGNRIKVQSNAFGIKLNDVTIYRYDVMIHADIGRKNVEFTKKGKQDFVVNDRKEKCVSIFKKAVQKMISYSPSIIYYYDGQSILYTTEQLNFGDQRAETVGVPGNEIMEDLEPFPMITFVISKCQESFECNVSDVRNANRDPSNRDRSAAQFLEIASNMIPLIDNTGKFSIFQGGKVFCNNTEAYGIRKTELGEAKELVNGVKKSVRVIEGPKGRGGVSAAFVVDSMKSPFHKAVPLMTKFEEILNGDLHKPLNAMQIDNINNQSRGIGCFTTHTKKPRRVEIFGVTKESAKDKMIEVESGGTKRRISVNDYFKEKYNLLLKCPHLPMVWSRERGQVNMYPVECLKIIPMQRVALTQTTSGQSQIMTRACAVPPAQRQTEIMQQVNMIGLKNGNKYFESLGVGILPTPLIVDARVLPPPKFTYANNATETASAEGKWRTPRAGYKFVKPAQCDVWAMYGLINQRDRFSIQELQEFGKRYMTMCQSHGIRMNGPVECSFLQPAGSTNLEAVVRLQMKKAAEHGCQFIFFISSESFVFHKFIKLEERYSNVITQDLKLRTAQNVILKNQNQTLENIVFKTNIKLGGLNYKLNLAHITNNYDMLPKERLIVGLSVMRAPPSAMVDSLHGKSAAPAVVGYAANTSDMAEEYIGDFMYQENRGDQLIYCLQDIFRTIIKRYCGELDKQGKEQPPTRAPPREIIVFRQGVDENAYASVVKREIPVIHAVMKECKMKPYLTFIAVHKEHNVRLMRETIDPKEKAPGQNIGCGTVVDRQLTSPNFNEFYLNSHIALQGSARTPRYTVLGNDMNYSLNELQIVAHSLAFGFQIVNSPVSVPCPLYIANRYAERGSAMFVAKTNDEMATSEQRLKTALEIINEELPYRRTALGHVRVNA